MNNNELAFRATFRQVLASAKRLVMSRVANDNSDLRKLMAFALQHQTPSEYPFVLKYAFCRQERDGEKIVKIAAAVHLLQQSTFVTDDIFDSAELRYRYRPIYLQYGVNYAIIAAELLQAIALRCVTEQLERRTFSNTALALKLFNQILLDLYSGQYLDLHNSARPTVTPREYYHVIALGAGRFFRNIAHCGALLAGKPEDEVVRLGRFAYDYGMALFITDDIIDMQPARETGKTYASDLKGRRMRLPLILALQMGSRRQKELLNRFLRSNTTRQSHIRDVASVIRECGALKASKRVASRFLEGSLQSISKLPPSITTERFRWLAGSLFKAQGLE